LKNSFQQFSQTVPLKMCGISRGVLSNMFLVQHPGFSSPPDKEHYGPANKDFEAPLRDFLHRLAKYMNTLLKGSEK
jgi:hypothetical protein